MENVLKSLSFNGDLKWIHKEEGSGAKLYKSSVYYPDSRTEPKTQSGVTIDPGLDLCYAARVVIDDTLDFYFDKGLISKSQIELLQFAIGERRWGAIQWMKANEKYFKGSFLVDDMNAIYIMDKVTAPPYWKPLTDAIPELLKISSSNLAAAVHTALLSMSYNRGPERTINLAKDFIIKKDYEGLASAIASVRSATASLRNRRIRESNLIADVLEAEL
jgi:hypothetical protein